MPRILIFVLFFSFAFQVEEIVTPKTFGETSISLIKASVDKTNLNPASFKVECFALFQATFLLTNTQRRLPKLTKPFFSFKYEILRSIFPKEPRAPTHFLS